MEHRAMNVGGEGVSHDVIALHNALNSEVEVPGETRIRPNDHEVRQLC
jgi:hypothetical protein